VKALVTGAEGGIGIAIGARLEREGFDVERLDVVTGFDVTDPAAWEDVGPVDLAFLNAGVTTGTSEIRELTDEQYAQILGVNVDGVVLGVRRLARVMTDGAIVATASLAGLTATPSDPIYALTKHAVVGFVRSVASSLSERGISINAVCPGFADTAMVAGAAREALESVGFPLLTPAEVAEAAWVALTSGETGHAWVVQPGRPPLDFRFPTLPGPRADGERSVGMPPPLSA
jgi:NAD(P)-dependent dehydrogenase (short-subunit alcohol dehydrogenase family)